MIVGGMQKIKILNSYLLVSPAGMYVGTSYFYVNLIYKKREKHNGFGQSHCLKVCKKSAWVAVGSPNHLCYEPENPFFKKVSSAYLIVFVLHHVANKYSINF